MVYVPLLILPAVVLAWARTYTPIALERPCTSTITLSWLRWFLIVSLPWPPLILERRILPLCGRETPHAAAATLAAELAWCGATGAAAAGSAGMARAPATAAALTGQVLCTDGGLILR